MLLAIETTGDACGVALFDGNRLCAEVYCELPRSHDRLLASMYRQMLDIAAIPGESITRIAVSVGPGSFTGIRIGLGFAIGVALASGAALVPVPTLDSLAYALKGVENVGGRSRVLALIAAGGGNLYARLFELRPEFTPLTEPRIIASSRVAALIDENIAVVGPGALLLEPAVSDSVVVSACRLTAMSVGRLGLHLAYEGVAVPPAEVTPLYISPFAPVSRPT